MKGAETNWLRGFVGTLAITCATSIVHADVQINDLLPVRGTAGPEFGSTTWGNFQDHIFGGTTVHPDENSPNFFVFVTTGVLPTPKGKKFAAFIEVDYTNFSPGDFTNHAFDVLNIKPAGGLNVINGVQLVDSPGTVSSPDGYTIHWEGLGAQLMANPIVRIEWTQRLIPAPGSLALLGVATLVGARRRRRE